MVLVVSLMVSGVDKKENTESFYENLRYNVNYVLVTNVSRLVSKVVECAPRSWWSRWFK